MSACVIFPCTIKSRRRFLLAPAHLGSPGKKAAKWLWCVWVCVCMITHESDNMWLYNIR